MDDKRHPVGLFCLTYIEAWDRFNFYGIQAMLVLFLIQHFAFSDNRAYQYYSAYTALAFATPMVGGYVADKFFTIPSSVLLGILLSLAGFATCLLNGECYLLMGLTLILVGIGLIKGNITCLTGRLYKDKPQLRDGGYVIFYMGMNIGAVLGPLVYGFMFTELNWRYSFIFSIIGTISCLYLYIKHYRAINLLSQYKKSIATIDYRKCLTCLVITPIFIATILYLLLHPQLANIALIAVGIVIYAIVIYVIITRSWRSQKSIVGMIILCCSGIMFFACSMQTGSVLTLFIQRQLQHSIFGFQIPTVMFYSLEPILIIIMTPMVIKLWQKFNMDNDYNCIPIKVTTGLFMCAMSFSIFSLLAMHVQQLTNPTSLWLLVLGNLLLGIGELCIIPVIFSAIITLFDERYHGRIMGLWVMTHAMAGYIGSKMSQVNIHYAFVMSSDGFSGKFISMAGIMLLVTFIFLLLIPLLQKLLQTQQQVE